jgi:hypothetical protein
MVGWDEARILETESNSRYKKQEIGPCGMFNHSDQPTQFGHSSHLGLPRQ